MNQEKLLEEIKQIEDTFPVNDYTYRSVHLWPLVRFLLLLRFKNGFTEIPQKTYYPPKKFSLRTYITRFYIAVRHYFAFRKKLKKTLAGHTSAKAVLYTREVEYTDLVDSRKYNRLMDPYADYFKMKGLPFFNIGLGKASASPKVYEPIWIDENDFDIFYRARKIFRRKESSENMDRLLRETEKYTGVEISMDELMSSADKCFYYRDLFIEILKECRPQRVFLSAYYSFDTFGLLMACRELNIRTVDVQHGKQGKYHFMYSHWTQIPDRGYALLPDYFWNWGKESEENISKWMRKDSPHKAIIGGNLWMMRWKEKKIQDDPAYADFFSRLKNYKRVVLFSLQPVGNVNFPDFVLEVIRETAKDCMWLLRLHPRMSVNDLPAIKNIVANNPNTEMELSTSLPLFRLLEESSVHVTCWSSVAFEALSFDVPTIIIHPEGKSLYKEQIESGTFMYSENSVALKSQLLAGKKEAKSDYIVYDRASVNAAIDKIFSGQKK